MTALGTFAALIAAGAVAVGGVLSSDPVSSNRTALVIDAAAARDGRALVDSRLRGLDAQIRLPRTPREARTNVSYFARLGYRLVVAGPEATAAARSTGVDAVRLPDVAGALAAVARRRP